MKPGGGTAICAALPPGIFMPPALCRSPGPIRRAMAPTTVVAG